MKRSSFIIRRNQLAISCYFLAFCANNTIFLILFDSHFIDEGVFNISQNSNHYLDNDVESNDSQANVMDDDDNDDG